PGPTPRANTGEPVIVDDQATVADVDSPSFDGGMLMVEIAQNATASDRLNIRNQGTGNGQIGRSGNTISFSGTPIGTYTGEVSGSTPLIVTFNANANATAVQALVRNLAFRLADAEPNTSTRTLRFVVSDGDGGTSAPATKTLRVAPLADVGLALADVPASLEPGSPLVYTVTVTNKGPLTATGIVVTDVLPAELAFRAVDTSQGSCTTSGQTVTCRV